MTYRLFYSWNVPTQAVVITWALLCATGPLWAGRAFVDDFEDGNHADLSPVTWSRYLPPFDAGEVRVEDGSLILTPSGDVSVLSPDYHELDMVVKEELYHDVSVHTIVRGLGPNLFVAGISVLDTAIERGDAGESIAVFVVDDGRVAMNYVNGLDITNYGRAQTGFSFANQDVHLKVTVDHDLVTLKAWPDGSPEPDTPYLTANLPTGLSDPSYLGRIALIAGSDDSDPSPVAFRSVTVVPEPSSASLLAGCGLWLLRCLRYKRFRSVEGHGCQETT